MSAQRLCLSLTKGRQRYVFCYDAGQEAAVLGNLVRLAADPTSDFDWFDLAVLAEQVGERRGSTGNCLVEITTAS